MQGPQSLGDIVSTVSQCAAVAPRRARDASEAAPLRHRCVVELFVFLHCGGDRERIRVLEFGGVDVRVALNRFDANDAKCFLKEDQERLLAVVESGFGSLAPFNALIRSIFIDARATNLESLVVASSEDTARELKEVKEELKGLKEGMRALLQAQGIPAERLPLLMDDLSA